PYVTREVFLPAEALHWDCLIVGNEESIRLTEARPRGTLRRRYSSCGGFREAALQNNVLVLYSIIFMTPTRW
ncbi:MAG TPA: hypothetical protein VLG72_04940, partial [Nitrospirota bacterium]|nr:hypothetical protein [Nitrospirota bacterium]